MNTVTGSADHPILNAMTVDVEDYFQVSAFERHIPRSTWASIPLRVEGNVERILALFDEQGVKATFFTLGWVAQRLPSMVRRIVAEGHELASHGWSHQRVHNQRPKDFSQDVQRARALLEDIGGVAVRGYRAPSYSIDASTLWALDVLADAGYSYSSSIAPIRHDLYGMPEAPRFAFTAAEGRLTEIPITTIDLPGRRVSCGGGGWFRLYPYRFTHWALQRVNTADHQPVIFYFHPWEIDPAQPRQHGVGARTRLRHYLNLSRTEGRLRRLLGDFRWGPVARVYSAVIDPPPSIENSTRGNTTTRGHGAMEAPA